MVMALSGAKAGAIRHNLTSRSKMSNYDVSHLPTNKYAQIYGYIGGRQSSKTQGTTIPLVSHYKMCTEIRA